jgi:hypothetical protein
MEEPAAAALKADSCWFVSTVNGPIAGPKELDAGENCLGLHNAAEGEGGSKSDIPSWCSEVKEGTLQ